MSSPKLMSHLSPRPCLLALALSVACATQAAAQTAPPSSDEDQTASPEVRSLDTVSVSASRIDRAGFVAPTPTTVIGAVELEQGFRNNIGAVLNDLPVFRPTSSPQTTATNTNTGLTNANLRGLGVPRTLVLLDGRRFVGNGDLNSIPMALVKSVDVVTGGASAAWGSDAVAGVVNIVLDSKFQGLELEGRTGLSERNDNFEYFVSATGGTRFADGRGHIVFSGEFLDNEGIWPKTSRPNVGRWGQISNPNAANGELPFILSPDVVYSNSSRGGLILSGVLAGQTFNPDGTLRPFQFGQLFGANMVGGEGDSWDDITAASTPAKRYALFSRASFDVTDSIRMSADLRYTRMYNHYNWFPDSNRGGLVIQADNAFLSQDIRDRLAAAGQTQFTMGRLNHDFAQLTVDFDRNTRQATLALDGVFGDYWRWDAYVSRGDAETSYWFGNFRLARQYANAVDSVLDPATGLPVCRVTLTDPGNRCVPINLFGEGAPSQEAADYVTGTFWTRQRTRLETAGTSLRGEPFTLPHGPVSIATGIEARRESVVQTVDPRAANGEFAIFNPSAMSGSYTVKEAFLETLVPLMRDVPLLRSLDLNAGARFSEYSTSGGIWSWKLGLTNQITETLRLRATKSRDIRSANLAELYTTSTTLYTNIVDPVTNQGVYVLTNGGGNADLVPETSDTRTIGLVYEPGFARGLSLSLDYFNIEIDNIITTINGQDMVTRCFNGNTALCDYITRNPADQSIVRIRTPYVNLAKYVTSGFDFEALYNFSGAAIGLPGNFRIRGMATYVDTLTVDDGISVLSEIGSLGSTAGVPRWSGNMSVGYQNGGLGLDLRTRYVHSGYFNARVPLQNNARGSYTYFDMGFQYAVGDRSDGRFTVYGGINNLFDKQPPISSGASFYYDIVGRYYTLGARFRF